MYKLQIGRGKDEHNTRTVSYYMLHYLPKVPTLRTRLAHATKYTAHFLYNPIFRLVSSFACHLPSTDILFYPEDGGHMSFRNVVAFQRSTRCYIPVSIVILLLNHGFTALRP
jgi:hypothetical protein